MKTKNKHHNTNTNDANQSIQLEKNTRKKHSKYVEGIFWIIGGTYLLLGNFFPMNPLLNNIILFILGILLVASSLFMKLNKFYFLFGILLLGILLGNILADDTKVRWVWPSIIFVMGSAIVTYGVSSKPLKKVRYVVSGIIIIIISLLFFLSIFYRIPLSEILRKSWPAALILLGLTRISSIINTARQSPSDTIINEDITDEDATDMDNHITDDTVNDTKSDVQ